MTLVNKTFSQLITFTRASSATFVGSNGLIQSATTNTPRFDYDPVTLAAKGLLIEEQRTNLLTYSEAFTNVAWNINPAAISGRLADQSISPSGDLTADEIDFILQNDTDLGLGRQLSATGGVTYTFSVWGKANTGQDGKTLTIRIKRASSGTTFASSSIVAVLTNTWQRFTVSLQLAPDNIDIDIRISARTSDGATSAFLWGAQLEAGSFDTSYIPTVASQVTRSVDVALVNTLSPWYNATEGTLYAEASIPGLTSSGNSIATISDGTLNNRFGIYALSTNSAVGGYMRTSGTTVAELSVNTVAANSAIFKSAFGYKANDFAFSANGGAALTDTSGTIATVNRLLIGTFLPNGTYSAYGHIRRITYYKRRLSNADLQSITL